MEEERADFKIMGTCRYCGQMKAIKTIHEITEEEANEITTKECTCKEAKIYQNRQKKIDAANGWANKRFEATPEVIALFREAFRSVTNNEVEKISIKANEWTHSVFLDNEGFLNVKSSRKVDEEVEFS